MSELSHFEELSAKTPKKEPYAILIGAVLLVVVLWLLNHFAPTEGVKDLKEGKKEEPVVTMPKAPVDEGDDI